jgi:hypothetical protein
VFSERSPVVTSRGFDDAMSQERRASLLVHREQALPRGRRHDLRGRFDDLRTLLAHVELGQVEAEDLRLADKVPQAPVGDPLSAVAQKASPYDQQVLDQLARARVRRLRVRVFQRASQATGHEEQLSTVDLVRVQPLPSLGHLRLESLAFLHRAAELV